MNQHQRKFLIETIDRRAKEEKAAWRERKPRAPSLNNYLTAEILAGTARFRDMELIRSTLFKRVRELGPGEALVERPHQRTFARYDDDDESQGVISMPAEVLFELPAEYAEALKDYEQKLEAWRQEGKHLEAAREAMMIKIQVGSEKALEALVNQADKLCELSLSSAAHLLEFRSK